MTTTLLYSRLSITDYKRLRGDKIVIVIVNIRIKACACTSKNYIYNCNSYINIIHNQIDNCYSVCPAAF